MQAYYRALLNKRTDIQAHLPALFHWTVELRPEWIIELGVRFGVSTTAFLAALDEVGEGKLWSCDIDTPTIPTHIRHHPRWRFAHGDDCELDSLNPPPPKSCGLLFIDTSHTHAHTRRELDLYAPRVKRGGLILMHDVDEAECGQAMREWAKDRNDVTNSHGLGAMRL